MTKKLLIELDDQLHKDWKLHAVNSGESMSSLVRTLIEEELYTETEEDDE